MPTKAACASEICPAYPSVRLSPIAAMLITAHVVRINTPYGLKPNGAASRKAATRASTITARARRVLIGMLRPHPEERGRRPCVSKDEGGLCGAACSRCGAACGRPMVRDASLRDAPHHEVQKCSYRPLLDAAEQALRAKQDDQ